MCAPPQPLPPPPHDALLLRVRTSRVTTSRRTALLLIGAPLVSGFASMAGCHDNENWFQTLMSAMPADQFDAGVDPSMLSCSFMAMTDGCADNPNKPKVFDLVCAGTCQYNGPCTGDGALAVLFSDDDEDENADDDDEPMTCSMFAMLDGMGGLPDMGAVGTQLYSIAREICAPARRARKMTDAAPVDASKAHKLAAAMLRSTKTMAHRLAQVAVSQPPRRAPPDRLPACPRARPSPPEHTI